MDIMRMTLISAIALIAVTAGCKDEEIADSVEIRPVRAVRAEAKADVATSEVVGDIRPHEEIDVSFRVAGKMIERRVNVGDRVVAGDMIARLDEADGVNRLESAKADAEAAEAVLVEAETVERRQRALLQKDIVSPAAYDSAARSLASARATAETAEVAVRMAEDQIAYTLLVADKGGIVTAVGADGGQVVNAGQMIVRIAPEATPDAVFNASETDVRNGVFKAGSTVQVALLSDPTVLVDGIVREISPIADPATRTFQIKVGLEEAPPGMLFGSAVTGTASRTGEIGIELPSAAIFDKSGQPAVWVYSQPSGLVTLAEVEIARFDEGKALVEGGITAGDFIVTAGVNQLREGQRVTLLEE
jgi:membrane fusion protein, multidrug efflux system